jgi:hypothetical protein
MKDIMFEKDYHFNIKDAMEYGLPEAVMLSNIKWWVIRNKANEKNFHDERTWTFNSVRAYGELFPFWSDKQIRRVLDSLVNQGAIISGNYNKTAYDRTKWYALADEMKSLCPNGQMEVTKKTNQVAQKGEPIPYINADVKTDNKDTPDGVDTDKDKLNKEKKKWLYAFFAEGYKNLYGNTIDFSGIDQGAIKNMLKKKGLEDKCQAFFLECEKRKDDVEKYGWILTPSNLQKKWNTIMSAVDTKAEEEDLKRKDEEFRRKKREEIEGRK